MFNSNFINVLVDRRLRNEPTQTQSGMKNGGVGGPLVSLGGFEVDGKVLGSSPRLPCVQLEREDNNLARLGGHCDASASSSLEPWLKRGVRKTSERDMNPSRGARLSQKGPRVHLSRHANIIRGIPIQNYAYKMCDMKCMKLNVHKISYIQICV